MIDQLLASGGMTNAKSNAFCPGDPLVVVMDLATRQELQAIDRPIRFLRWCEPYFFLAGGILAGIGEGASGASLAFWAIDQEKPVHSIKMNSGYAVDLHPDGLRLAVSHFETNGRGGNGRHSTPETYISNDGVIDIYNLYEKPAE